MTESRPPRRSARLSARRNSGSGGESGESISGSASSSPSAAPPASSASETKNDASTPPATTTAKKSPAAASRENFLRRLEMQRGSDPATTPIAGKTISTELKPVKEEEKQTEKKDDQEEESQTVEEDDNAKDDAQGTTTPAKKSTRGNYFKDGVQTRLAPKTGAEQLIHRKSLINQAEGLENDDNNEDDDGDSTCAVDANLEEVYLDNPALLEKVNVYPQPILKVMKEPPQPLKQPLEQQQQQLQQPPEQLLQQPQQLSTQPPQIPPVMVNTSNQEIMSYLTNQCGLQDSAQLDLSQDIDPSSLAFLRGLASASALHHAGSHDAFGSPPAHITSTPKTSHAKARSFHLSSPSSAARQSEISNVTTANNASGNAKKFNFNTANLNAVMDPNAITTPIHKLTPNVKDISEATKTSSSSKAAISSPIHDNSDMDNYNNNNNNNEAAGVDSSSSALQLRMLNLLEQQSSQMQELQARLDAMGAMMAQMEQEMRLLRYGGSNSVGSVPPIITGSEAGVASAIGNTRGYGRMGGLFDGAGQTTFPQQPNNLFPAPNGSVWRRGQRDGAATVRRMDAVGQALADAGSPLPEGWMEVFDPHSGKPYYYHEATKTTTWVRPSVTPQQPLSAPSPAASATAAGDTQVEANQNVIVPDPPLHRGIFFPMLLSLFQFLVSLPQRLRGLLLHTGPGRVYAHIRREAIERRAFANLDMSSLIKLMIMVLIISGRMGGRNAGGAAGGGRGANRRRVQGQQQGAGDDNEEGFAYVIVGLLQTLIDFWNSHRVHTLVMASMIAFLVQVGLMSFFYQVIWVEREELFRVWMGREEEAPQEERGETSSGNGEGGNGENNADGNPRERGPQHDRNAALPAAGNANPAAVAAPNANGRMRPNVRPAVAPAGRIIRRGPNNGGVFHDLQCLILSFLLSLIPAWKPEEAAQPPEEQGQQQQQPEGQEAGA